MIKTGTIIVGRMDYNQDFIGIVIEIQEINSVYHYLVHKYGNDKPYLYKAWEIHSSFKELKA
jgi:hypothetical protein